MITRSELEALLPRVDPYMEESIKEELTRVLLGDKAVYKGFTCWYHGTITEVFRVGPFTYAKLTSLYLVIVAPVEDWVLTVDGWTVTVKQDPRIRSRV